MFVKRILFAAIIVFFPIVTAAQTGLSFKDLSIDPAAPIEMSADNLFVDQLTSNAEFSGNVVISQGTFRMDADKTIIVYSPQGGILELNAQGGVQFSTQTETAKAQSAKYSISDQKITMQGNVILVQGAYTLRSDKIIIDITTGKAIMTGRVRTTLLSGTN